MGNNIGNVYNTRWNKIRNINVFYVNFEEEKTLGLSYSISSI